MATAPIRQETSGTGNEMKTLEIFALCERLAKLLGDKEAIADLQRLYARHPEMFQDMQEVSEVISAVCMRPKSSWMRHILIKTRGYIRLQKD